MSARHTTDKFTQAHSRRFIIVFPSHPQVRQNYVQVQKNKKIKIKSEKPAKNNTKKKPDRLMNFTNPHDEQSPTLYAEHFLTSSPVPTYSADNVRKDRQRKKKTIKKFERENDNDLCEKLVPNGYPMDERAGGEKMAWHCGCTPLSGIVCCTLGSESNSSDFFFLLNYPFKFRRYFLSNVEVGYTQKNGDAKIILEELHFR